MSYTACFNTANLDLGCASSTGGIKELVVLAGAITATTYDGDGQLTSAVGTGNTYSFKLQKQTSNMTETFNVSLENGTTFVQQDVSAVFNKIDKDKRNQLSLLLKNRQIVLFVKDNNDNIYYLGGEFDGGYVSAGTGETGTAYGDRNGYTLTITTFSTSPAPLLDDTLENVLSGITIN